MAHCFDGFNLVDWGRHEEAFAAYDRALTAAEACGAVRREIWVRGIGSWGQLRAGRAAVAEEWARRALALCDRERWLSFRPWPEAVLAEVRLDAGDDPAAVSAAIEAPLAMARQLGDPCSEAALARVTGLAHAREGRSVEALSWLERAEHVLTAVTDPYAALLVRILMDRVRIARQAREGDADDVVRRVLELAARTHADVELGDAISLRTAAHKRNAYIGGGTLL